MSSKLKEETMSDLILSRCNRFVILLAALFGFTSFFGGGSAWCKPRQWDRVAVVIDPGHGGGDRGAVGPDGSVEKNIALNLALALQSGFKEKYRVRLTRRGDYATALCRRAELANHEKAAVFISIHAGGSFARNGRAMNIFYYGGEPVSGDAPFPGLGETAPSAPSGPVSDEWGFAQYKHASRSRVLASAVRESLHARKVCGKVSVGGAPLMVLSGADMPAILIEAGNLANPVDGKRLNDPLFLHELARGIVSGIDSFLKKYK